MNQVTHNAWLAMMSFLFLALSSVVTRGADSIFYSTTFDSTDGWFGQLNPANGTGGTLQTNIPFVVNGVSMGSYMDATYYPTTLVTPAVASTDLSVWLGFLLREGAGPTWLGGVNLTGSTNDVQWNGPYLGQVGSQALNPIVTLYNGD